MCQALGLGHAILEGNLLAEMVNDGMAAVPECETNTVTTANHWKSRENSDANTDPNYPKDDSITC